MELDGTDHGVRIETDTDPSLRRAVRANLSAFNDSRSSVLRGFRARGEADEVPLDLYAFDGEELVAGLVADTWGRWLQVDLLWVHEDRRGSGLGSRLLGLGEQRARDERACIGVRLDTWGFQAKPFYESLGYAVFGVLEDYPPGETEYLLAKRLD
jgi:GNAT superfamily N-acetyltransferase